MEKDRYGYSQGSVWHVVCAEHNDALVAHQLSGHCSSAQTIERIESAEIELKKLRRRIEDRLRKDRYFLYEVAAIFNE